MQKHSSEYRRNTGHAALLLSNFWDVCGNPALAEFRNFPCSNSSRSRARLILAISLTVAVACAISRDFSISQQRALTRLALDQQLKLQYDSVIAAIDYEGRAALAVSAVIAALPPVGDAIAKGDRDAWPRCSATPTRR